MYRYRCDLFSISIPFVLVNYQFVLIMSTGVLLELLGNEKVLRGLGTGITTAAESELDNRVAVEILMSHCSISRVPQSGGIVAREVPRALSSPKSQRTRP